jgi:hypothetical protein
MKRRLITMIVALAWLGLTAWPGWTAETAPAPPDDAAAPASLTTAAADCAGLAELVKAENSRLSGELRRVQREVAALRADLDKPGSREIFAGIGYILGLFGVAAFVAARRRKE